MVIKFVVFLVVSGREREWEEKRVGGKKTGREKEWVDGEFVTHWITGAKQARECNSTHRIGTVYEPCEE